MYRKRFLFNIISEDFKVSKKNWWNRLSTNWSYRKYAQIWQNLIIFCSSNHLTEQNCQIFTSTLIPPKSFFLPQQVPLLKKWKAKQNICLRHSKHFKPKLEGFPNILTRTFFSLFSSRRHVELETLQNLCRHNEETHLTPARKNKSWLFQRIMPKKNVGKTALACSFVCLILHSCRFYFSQFSSFVEPIRNLPLTLIQSSERKWGPNHSWRPRFAGKTS